MDSVDIVGRLLPGFYDVLYNHPQAEDRFETFVKDVLKRIPELSGREDEVDVIVFDAVQDIINDSCKCIAKAEANPTSDYHAEVNVYECHHQRLGTFYVSIYENSDAVTASGYRSVLLTRKKEKALADYEDVISRWEELGVEYEKSI